jgi:hypothetical protein
LLLLSVNALVCSSRKLMSFKLATPCALNNWSAVC